jgi:hypothetical protein
MAEVGRLILLWLESRTESNDMNSGPWKCPTCGEEIDEQYGQCINCGRLGELCSVNFEHRSASIDRSFLPLSVKDLLG